MSARLDHRRDARPPQYKPRFGIEALSRTEHAVARELATGKANDEIAAAMFVTTQATKFHVSNILRKLGVRNRAQAAVMIAAHFATNRPAVWQCCHREVYTPFCPWCGTARPEEAAL